MNKKSKGKKIIKNIASSVRERLLNISRETGRDFNSILLQYFQERLLYRTSLSDYRDNFILKGGLSFLIYKMPDLRPTKDIDLLGYSISNELGDIRSIFQEIIKIEVPDGVIFIPESLMVERIKTSGKTLSFQGVRVKIEAQLTEAKKVIQIDIGFGDKVVPDSIEADFPVLLDLPVPRIYVYSKESIIAEKFHSIVEHDFLNSRMKDFYDILYLSSHNSFRLNTLREAIYTTFAQRKTSLEDREVIFSEKFKRDEQKQKQWTAFLFKNKLLSDEKFNNVIERIELFLDEVCRETYNETENIVWDFNLSKWI